MTNEGVAASTTAIDALVLDANAFGKSGALDVNRLIEWAQLVQDENLVIWLPEPVLWESGIHAVEAVEELVQATRSANRLLSRAHLPIPEIPPYGDRQRLIETLTRSVEDLEPEVEIIPCSPEAAVEGLKDQILQRSPASLKSGVRTGASDSTWVRSVEEHAIANNKSYAIVSADSHVENAIKTFGFARTIYRDLQVARRDLFQYTTAPGTAIAQLIRYLKQLPEEAQWASVISFTELRNEDHVVGRLFGPYKLEEVRQVDVELAGIGPLVGLSKVEIDRTGGRLLAEVSYCTTPEVTIWYDTEVEGDIQLVSDTLDIPASVVTVSVALETEDNVIVRGQSVSEATLMLPYRGVSEENEALNELAYAFDYVPGLDGDAIFAALDEQSKWKGQLFEKTRISIERYHSDGYKDMEECEVVEVTINDDSASVSWAYDPNSWVGGGDGFHLDDPYLLSVGFASDLEENPTWALPAWILERVPSD